MDLGWRAGLRNGIAAFEGEKGGFMRNVCRKGNIHYGCD
jgi:hypothetical protein